MIVAILPARGGSKRIPGKNVKAFAGRPILHYPIEAARRAGVFDRIVVSTDSEEIARAAEDAGAEVPFLRPPELAGDHAATAPVLAHAVRALRAAGAEVEYLCCLYPTAPFVQAEHLRQGYERIVRERVSSVFSVTTFAFPIFRALRIGEDGRLSMFWPENESVRSQDLPEAYHDAGQFYWLEAEAFLRTERIYAPDALPVVVPRYLVQDIDTPEDWETAERMWEALALRASGGRDA